MKPPENPYTLNELVSKITVTNIHEEVDWGPGQGAELIYFLGPEIPREQTLKLQFSLWQNPPD